jgi:dephospho-CoA kinase
MKLLIVTGMPGTGKEEFLRVAKEMGISFMRMGDVVRETYGGRKDMSIGEFASAERKEHGYEIWAKRSLEKMEGDLFLVDGCRSAEEVDAFRSLTDDVVVIAIHSSPEARYSRLKKRNRDDAPSTLEEFNERDNREMDWGLAKLMALSDMTVPNESTLEEFRRLCAEVLERFG